MTTAIDPALCAACSKPVDEPIDTLPSNRKPCPSCGSLTRIFNISLHETLVIREKYGTRHKRPGLKKPIHEAVSGYDLYRDTGQWNMLMREIDRENNRYKEIITNPENGEVLRYCDEPLTDHFDHGSAKTRKDS